MHEALGHSDLAVAAYEQAIEHDLENAVLYARLGALYRRRTLHAEARVMYEMAAERAGDDPGILFELAQLHVEEDGATTEARKLLEKVVWLEAGHAQAHLLLGDVYLGQQRGLQAVQHYERACQLASPGSRIGREARRKLSRLRPSTPDHQAQGWMETLRRTSGLMLTPALAALVNAGLSPWRISLAAWGGLVVSSVGAYLWVCATDVPRNPAMRKVFGPAGVKGLEQQVLVGIPGLVLWTAALGLILLKV